MSFRPVCDEWFLSDSLILARPKVKYFGAYPAGFLLKARDLLGVGRQDQVLHVCSGMVRDYKCGPSCKGQTTRHFHGLGDYDVTFDLDEKLKPDVVGDARNEDHYFNAISEHPQIQAILADPPYFKFFAKMYRVGAAVMPTADEIVKHSIAILPVGGRVGVLSMHWPRYPKDNARQIAVIAVYVGNGNIARCYAVYEKTK